jgi:predicted enzyme related to lactoylglutathione lyase
MRIKLTSIMVDDQDKALKFYTEVLGFVKRKDIPVGEYRWITEAFQEALFKQGIPATAFEVGDIEQEHRRLENRSVVFTQTPTPQGPVTIAIFADTCGNLIQLYEPPPADGPDV